ncbi:MAG: alanyl-tRNA editing protein, partial [bacterium]|nr:alanyl-tRNA editing protein [bacterium]
MTVKIYYDDNEIELFDAKVVDVRVLHDSILLELNRTAFYVEGGGQPSDEGYIEGYRMVRAFLEEGRIWHQVIAPNMGWVDVRCRVNLALRQDYATQHTGQHLLSQAFWRLFEGATSSFHLSNFTGAIDIALPHLSQEEIKQAEALANEMVRHNLPVATSIIDDVASLPAELR